MAVTDEPMTDAQAPVAAAPADGMAETGDDPVVVDAQPVSPAAADETAGTNLDGLTQLINQNVKPGKIDPTKPAATAGISVKPNGTEVWPQ